MPTLKIRPTDVSKLTILQRRVISAPLRRVGIAPPERR
jgi:hypothetical protein